MVKNVEEARIVITHGGPASFIMPLQIGKIPIVVPRQKRFDEHVNDHQVEFCRAVAERQKNIIIVENMENLKNILINYSSISVDFSTGINSNNTYFNDRVQKIAEKLLSVYYGGDTFYEHKT